MSTLVELRNVSVDVDGRSVLRNVTLTCEAGAITAVVGAAGAGKSTLLGVLAGTVAIDYGVMRREHGPIVHCDQAWSREAGEVVVDPAWSLGDYRIALLEARSHRVERALVVLDEPTRSLDPKSSAVLAERVQELASRGCAVVFASHDRSWTRALAHSAVLVDEGRMRVLPPHDVDFLSIQQHTLTRLRHSSMRR